MQPAMSAAEAALLARYQATAKSYFEWGCGGSTVQAAQQGVEKACCVDSVAEWIGAVRPHVPPTFTFVHADIGADPDNWGRPKDDTTRPLWPTYSGAIEQYGRDADVILVDGRFRVACALKAIRLRPNSTVLVHDYTVRPHYRVLERFLKRVDGVGSMAVFQRWPVPAHPIHLSKAIAEYEYQCE
jgi:hypothetical protein